MTPKATMSSGCLLVFTGLVLVPLAGLLILLCFAFPPLGIAVVAIWFAMRGRSISIAEPVEPVRWGEDE